MKRILRYLCNIFTRGHVWATCEGCEYAHEECLVCGQVRTMRALVIALSLLWLPHHSSALGRAMEVRFDFMGLSAPTLRPVQIKSTYDIAPYVYFSNVGLDAFEFTATLDRLNIALQEKKPLAVRWMIGNLTVFAQPYIVRIVPKVEAHKLDRGARDEIREVVKKLRDHWYAPNIVKELGEKRGWE